MQLRFTVPESAGGCKLASFLRANGMSTGRIRSVKFREDGLRVNGVRARTNQLLQPGDEVLVQLPPDEAPSAREEHIPLTILYEDENAMVVDKPAGMVMHPTRSHKAGTMAGAFTGLMAQRGTPAAFRPIGRLDGGTSGLVLLAMNAYAAPGLAKGYAKGYLAIAAGRMAGRGTIDAPLGPAADSVVRQCVRADGRRAVTHYEVLATGESFSVLVVRLATGRTHQIRAHMAHAGHPLVGDCLYGGPMLLPRHALHCAALRFTPPGGRDVCQHSPLPADMAGLLKSGEIDPAALAKLQV